MCQICIAQPLARTETRETQTPTQPPARGPLAELARLGNVKEG